MATCGDVIALAWRKLGQTRPGQSLTGRQLDDGLERLQALFDDWLSRGVFGRLQDVTASGDVIAGENQRVTAPSTAAVSLPERVDGRPPRDLAAIVVVQGEPADAFVRDARAGAWVRITGLTAGAVCPLASRDPHGMAAALAESLGEIAPHEARAAVRFRASLAANAGAAEPEIKGSYA